MRRLLADIFSWSLVLYLILFLLENIFPRLISDIISLNYLLIPVLMFGVASSVFPSTEIIEDHSSLRSNIILSAVLSLVGGGLIYYKIDLTPLLRIGISLLSTLLILLMSLLVVLPEDFKLPKLSKKYLYLLLLLLPLLFFIKLPQSAPTIIRVSPDQYKILLINRSTSQDYSEVYKKLLVNNGYKNVITDTSDEYPDTTSGATVMFSPGDNLAGQEVASVIGLSYKDTQTSPLIKPAAKTIVVIIK